jgi:cobalt-zinc-cadmium resistance protein CzcA
MTGAKQDVVCKVFGENLDTLSKYSKILGKIAEKIDGAKDIYVEPLDGLPQLIINYNRQLIAQFGLNIQDVNKTVNTAFAGQSSGTVYEDEKRFDLVVRLAGENRQNLEDVKNLLIPTPLGSQIPLQQVADISIQQSVNQIQRDDAKRRIIVGFNVRGRDVKSIVSDLRDQVAKVKMPSGYYVTYGGAFENLVAAQNRLLIAVPISLAVIFFLLYFAFNSVKQGLLIYSAIPLSAIGGILFLAMRGMPFSISAGIGFIALFGVAVLNGIVLISEYNRIRKSGETELINVVLEGTRHRLRPVLMTALVASLGFLPMALSHGAGAEVQRPLATVVIGGLLVATLLTLFVLPVLYILFEKRTFKKHAEIIPMAIILLSFLSFQVNAQSVISLNAALDTALKNNLLVKNEKLNAECQKKMKATVTDIPQATLTGEYGQINSNYMDTKFGISQSFNFPTVYTKRKNLQNEQYKSYILNIAVREAELKKQVSEQYVHLVYLFQKQQILRKIDSTYALLLQQAALRFSKGESSILEKVNAEIHRGQIFLQLNQLKNDIELERLQFQLLMNTTTAFVPTLDDLKMEFVGSPDAAGINNHPEIKMMQQQKQISALNTKVERAKLLPDLIFGYNNQSIRGMGADNVIYTGSSRFSSVHVGVGLPLFFGSQKAKISTSKTQELISENNYRLKLQRMNLEFQKAFNDYQLNIQTIKYFEESALKNAETITTIANQQMVSGDISYSEWNSLMTSAVTVQSDYTEALKKLNLSVIQLHYLITK